MKLSEKISRNKSKLIRTALVYLSSIALGGTMALIGSSLLDLQIQVQESMSDTSKIITTKTLGYLLGGILVSFIQKYLPDGLALLLGNMISAIFFTIAPWSKNLIWLEILVFIGGIGQALLDNYCNLSMLHIWGDKSSSFMQILTMCFGIGSLITPIIAGPFLLPTVDDVPNDPLNSELNTTNSFTPQDVKVHYAFLIIGSYTMLIGLLFSYYCIQDLRLKFANPGENSEKSSSEEQKMIPAWKQYIAVFLVAIMAHLMFGMEGIIGNFAPTFGVKSNLKMSKSSAALLVTAFWTCFALSKITFIAFSLLFGEKLLTNISIVIMLAAVVLLIPFAAKNQLCTWISFILLGIGYSPLFAIAYSSLEKYFPVNARQTAIILVGGLSSDSIHLRVIGSYIEDNSNIFIYYLGFFAFFSTVSMFLFPFVCRWLFREQTKKTISKKSHFPSFQN